MQLPHRLHARQFNIEKLISWLGGTLAAFVIVVGPLSYCLFSLHDLGDDLAFRARLSSTQAAKYIYANSSLWQFRPLQLREVIEQPGDRRSYNQLLRTSDGKTIVDEEIKLPWPEMSQSADIIVNGEAVGTIKVSTSLLDTIFGTMAVALLFSALGIATFVGLRVIPIASLRRAFAELDYERQEVEVSNRKLGLALNTMHQGMALYDLSGELILQNERLSQLIGIDPTASAPRQFANLLGWLRLSNRIQGYTSDDIASIPTQELECKIGGDRVCIALLQGIEGTGILVTLRDVTEQRHAQAKIEYLAHVDTLTGLTNRASYQRQLMELLSTLTADRKVAVMCIDLDRFKAVNDTLGHPTGDELLRLAAQRLRSSVRSDDVVARVGGDEFAVMLTNPLSVEEVGPIAERILHGLGSPFTIDSRLVDISGSIGIALAPDHGTDKELLLKRADIALYESKAAGRSTYRIFETGMDERIQRRHELERDLRRAVVAEEFELHYQPLYGLINCRVEGFEALIRWNHPIRGTVSPLDFIPVAEHSGLIKSIGDWVLRRACRDAASWPRRISVAVNLSAVQFSDETLVESVADALMLSGLEPNRLELEITESIILNDTDTTLDMLRRIKELGVRIAMDDFGTGYSSLSYLQKFPFDKIKIDRSFVDRINSKKDSLAIVRAVTSMSRSLGIKTTGEGVETDEELACLRAEGCSQAQGFLISKPVPAASVLNTIASVEAHNLQHKTKAA